MVAQNNAEFHQNKPCPLSKTFLARWKYMATNQTDALHDGTRERTRIAGSKKESQQAEGLLKTCLRRTLRGTSDPSSHKSRQRPAIVHKCVARQHKNKPPKS